MLAEELTQQIIGAAIEVHKQLGAGLLESSYERCLCRELSLREIPFKCQLELPIIYKGLVLESGYRIDLLVDDEVVVEIKAVEKILPIHEAQLLTYLRLSGNHVGLLINFNAKLLKDGLKRIVHDF